MMGEPTETADLSSWEYMDLEQIVKEHGTNLSPLYVCVTVVKLGQFVRFLAVRSGTVCSGA